MKPHCQKAVDGRGVVCLLCGKRGRDMYHLREHLEAAHAHLSPGYQCQLCAQEFKSHNSWKVHMKKYHWEMRFRPVTVFLSSQSREALTTCVAGNDRSILLKYVERELLVEGSLFKCTLCGKSGAQKNNVVNHVENIHFPGTFQYICPVCNKPMITKKALDNHIHRNHKENSSQYSAH